MKLRPVFKDIAGNPYAVQLAVTAAGLAADFAIGAKGAVAVGGFITGIVIAPAVSRYLSRKIG
ncbi:MAG: hypothetical protein WC989_00330 [Micavibrio sp.]